MDISKNEDWVQMLPDLVDDPADKESGSFNVHLYSLVRFKFADIRASSMEEAIGIASERLFSDSSLARINVEGQKNSDLDLFEDMVLQDQNPTDAVVDPLNKSGEVIYSKSKEFKYDSENDRFAVT